MWNRIKPKTTYRIEFQTDTLAARAVAAIKKMEKIEPPKIKVTAGRVVVRKGGVATEAVNAAAPRRSRPRTGAAPSRTCSPTCKMKLS